MLFTPMLPELAAGIVEVRNVMTPLAMVCPHAEVITGRVTDLTLGDGRAEVETDGGLRISISYDHVVIGVGAVPRTFPVPGLIEHAVGCTTVLDALYLRNQLLRLLAAAALEPDPDRRSQYLTFVFVGGGYAGVEALAELRDLAHDALRYHPNLRDVPQRWCSSTKLPRSWPKSPLGWASTLTTSLSNEAVDIRLRTRLEKVVDGRVTLSDGTELETGLLVWTAGVKANPIVAHFGLPLERAGPGPGKPDSPGRRPNQRLCLWPLRRRAQRRHPWPGRPPDQLSTCDAKRVGPAKTLSPSMRDDHFRRTASSRLAKWPPSAAERASPT